MTFFEDLQWRGLVGQTIGNVEELLKTPTTFYCGFDPTSISKDNLNPKYPEITSSLHIGHLLALITCKRFQMNGHKPIMLVGGFTGLVGDGSFRTEDRQLLSVDEVENNIKCISKQIKHLIDFSDDKALFVNNAEWLNGFSLIDFLRGIGKSVSLNYLISKDSVRNRLEREGCGISLCESLYGPLQGYDFVHLNQKFNCKLSVNGTDQIGNATYASVIGKKLCGIESDNFNVLAWPLVTKADGSKFGKSMSGKCIWLDKHLTSVYDFYQFWLNQSDEDAKKFIKLFTLLSKEEIEHLIEEHDKAPHNRLLQKRLAEEVTIMVHSKEECDKVISASNVLFGGGSIDTFKGLDDDTIMSIFDGCPIHSISKEIIGDGIKLISLCTDIAPLFQSKGDLRKLIKNNGISVNKEKVSDTDLVIMMDNFINDKFLIVQQGKKNYNLIYID
jgi:tyrosyl-tRNA synthetase